MRFVCSNLRGNFILRQMQTGAIIFHRRLHGLLFFTKCRKSFFCTKTIVGIAFVEETLYMLAIKFEALGLDVWTLVWWKPHCFERRDQCVNCTRNKTRLVCVFNAQNKRSILLFCVKITIKRRAESADVKVSRW